jgi:hypothetical protein
MKHSGLVFFWSKVLSAKLSHTCFICLSFFVLAPTHPLKINYNFVMARKDCCRGACGTTFEAKRWMSLDPCGLIGVCSSASLHTFALIVISTHLLSDSKWTPWMFICIYIPTLMMALTSLYMAWSSDPGAVPLGARPLIFSPEENPSREIVTNGLDVPLSVHLQKGVRRCQKCSDNFKPPRYVRFYIFLPIMELGSYLIHNVYRLELIMILSRVRTHELVSYQRRRQFGPDNLQNHIIILGRCVVKMDHFW